MKGKKRLNGKLKIFGGILAFFLIFGMNVTSENLVKNTVLLRLLKMFLMGFNADIFRYNLSGKRLYQNSELYDFT